MTRLPGAWFFLDVRGLGMPPFSAVAPFKQQCAHQVEGLLPTPTTACPSQRPNTAAPGCGGRQAWRQRGV